MRTIVIGAGMAGLAAARDLSDAGQEVVVLEARDRIGGRVHTRRDIAEGVPVEMGAEFIHGDAAPTWEIAQTLGSRTLHWEKLDDSLVRTEGGDLITMHEARQDPLFDITRTWDLPDVSVHPEDENLHRYLLRLGFTPEQLQYTRRSFVNAHGESIDHISAIASLADMQDETAGAGDYRVMEGYDTFVKFLADGLDIRLSTPVERIAWGNGVAVRAAGGQVFDGAAAVVAVPTGVLLAEKIAFEPELPDDKLSALGSLPMGPGLKLVYVFERSILPPDVTALYSAGTPPMWWSPSFGHAGAGQFVITAFATGNYARDLLALGEAGAKAKGLATLRAELGEETVPDPVSITLKDWTSDPYTLGVYSTVVPGGAACRAVLAEPLAGRLFFAGEATASNGWAATVHGAYTSGQRAAREVLAANKLSREA